MKVYAPKAVLKEWSKLTPKAVLKEWSKLTVPRLSAFTKTLLSVLLFTFAFAGYFALCEVGALEFIQWLG